MTRKILRGRILTFHAEPQTPDDTQSYEYIEDGALIMSNGLIEAVGEYAKLQSQAAGAEVIDHRPHLLMAGFIDNQDGWVITRESKSDIWMRLQPSPFFWSKKHGMCFAYFAGIDVFCK